MQLHKNMSNSLTLQNYPLDFEDVNKKKPVSRGFIAIEFLHRG